jgi:hypothetical protein
MHDRVSVALAVNYQNVKSLESLFQLLNFVLIEDEKMNVK